MQDRFNFRFWYFNSVENKWKEYFCDLMSIDGTALPFDNGEGGAYTDYDHEFICEQCTGLKDKNGKLIYEGDIVKVIYNEELNTLSKQIYPMLFNDKVAKFGFKHPDGHFFYFTNDEDFSYEVIGNIHENADLLENKDD
jgi:uncharacterized phage protein (TIGR01671 family)